MKTVMVIDRADNCAYDCYLASDDVFARLFPGPGQDIEFIEDVLERESEAGLADEFAAMWRRRVPKKEVRGIDALLFCGLRDQKKRFYPTKRGSDLDLPLSPDVLRDL